MSTAQHTPGPWTNHGRIAQPGVPHSAVAAKTLIARVYSEAYGDTEQETANARLIAAAPELLSALRDMVDWLDDGNRQLSDACATDVNRARAVIAKATGSAS